MNQHSTIPDHPSIVPRYAWVVLAVVFTASVAAPLNQSKVPPLMPVLMDIFQLELGQAGLLMSVFAMTGALLALPAGFIIQRLGLKIAGLAAMGSLVLGAVLGALAANTLQLQTGRVIEGIGMGLIAVVAPSTIAAWFPPERRGTPMGIWATWMPAGTLTMFVVAPNLAAAAGWQSVWWLGAGFALLALVLYGLLMPAPAKARNPVGDPKPTPSFRQVLANRDAWLLTLVFFCFVIVMSGIKNYFPTFLHKERGYPLSQASLITSVYSLLVLVGAPLAGALSDRLNTRRMMIVAGFLVVAILNMFPYGLTGGWIVAFMVLFGLIVGAIPTATFSAVPEVMGKPEEAGIGLALVMLGQNVGMIVGPLLFAALVKWLGWAGAGYCMIPVCLLAAALAWQVRIR
jgi:MFS family permease